MVAVKVVKIDEVMLTIMETKTGAGDRGERKGEGCRGWEKGGPFIRPPSFMGLAMYNFHFHEMKSFRLPKYKSRVINFPLRMRRSQILPSLSSLHPL